MDGLKKLIEVGSDGGSVTLYQIKKEFFFTTEEFLFNDEFEMKDLTSKSKMFSTIEDSILGLVKTYSVFQLYPLFVDSQVKSLLKIYFDNFILYQGKENCWSYGDWKNCLCLDFK